MALRLSTALIDLEWGDGPEVSLPRPGQSFPSATEVLGCTEAAHVVGCSVASAEVVYERLTEGR
jgi:hypothetical protein